jgi:ribosomal protein L20
VWEMAIGTLKLVGELLEEKTGTKIEVDREVLAHLIKDSCDEYEQLVNELKRLKEKN